VSTERTELPQFTGINSFHDHLGRYEFRYPWDWIESELEDDREGVILRPVDEDQNTYFAVWVNELEVTVVADDLPDLREGFEAGLKELDAIDIEKANDENYNNIVKIERIFTFNQDGQIRKRRVWALYADRWQFLVVYQGSTIEEYEYWLPMGNYCFTAFKLPQALWFATDPSVSGAPKPPED
jgi:hypothetical protein